MNRGSRFCGVVLVGLKLVRCDETPAQYNIPQQKGPIV